MQKESRCTRWMGTSSLGCPSSLPNPWWSPMSNSPAGSRTKPAIGPGSACRLGVGLTPAGSRIGRPAHWGSPPRGAAVGRDCLRSAGRRRDPHRPPPSVAASAADRPVSPLSPPSRPSESAAADRPRALAGRSRFLIVATCISDSPEWVQPSMVMRSLTRNAAGDLFARVGPETHLRAVVQPQAVGLAVRILGKLGHRAGLGGRLLGRAALSPPTPPAWSTAISLLTALRAAGRPHRGRRPAAGHGRHRCDKARAITPASATAERFIEFLQVRSRADLENLPGTPSRSSRPRAGRSGFRIGSKDRTAGRARQSTAWPSFFADFEGDCHRMAIKGGVFLRATTQISAAELALTIMWSGEASLMRTKLANFAVPLVKKKIIAGTLISANPR